MELPQLSDEDILKLKAMIGEKAEPYKIEVDKSMLWLLAEAIGDTNPLWRDETKAKETRYRGVIAPPALCISYWMNPLANGKIILPVTVGRCLDAEHDWKFYVPIRPGDVITVRSKVIDVSEKQGKKSGLMIFYTYETTLTNQSGEKVAEEKGTLVIM